MKIIKNINILALLLIIVSCKAQSPIINNLDWDGKWIANAYIKDTNNDMNQFVGTYIYNNNHGVVFKIILKKVTMVPHISFYADMIIGEFEYYGPNGIASTIEDINTVFPKEYKHHIAGWRLIDNDEVISCDDCYPNQKRMDLKFNDTHVVNNLIIRKATVGSNEVLKVIISKVSMGHKIGDPIITPIVPSGEYTLIKQP